MEYRDRQKQVNCELVARFKKSGLIASKEHYNDNVIRQSNFIRHAIDQENNCEHKNYVCGNTNLEGFSIHLNNSLRAISATNTVDQKDPESVNQNKLRQLQSDLMNVHTVQVTKLSSLVI